MKADVDQLNENLRSIVGKRHPMLMAAADQIFGAGGKKMRPILCFLIARATQAYMKETYVPLDLILALPFSLLAPGVPCSRTGVTLERKK
jgi:geranylgeranyl pyrophosphate synthase